MHEAVVAGCHGKFKDHDFVFIYKKEELCAKCENVILTHMVTGCRNILLYFEVTASDTANVFVDLFTPLYIININTIVDFP